MKVDLTFSQHTVFLLAILPNLGGGTAASVPPTM